MRALRSVLACTAAAACLLAAAPSMAQTAYGGQWEGALSPDNMAKPRPKAPFDMTGTWNMVIDQKNGGANFLPLPKLKPAAQAEFDRTADYRARGLQWRDDSGACWPMGMPWIMGRFWPIQIIQLPTMVQLTTMFNNSARWIYTDGRPHPTEENLVYTYNGHSIGKWEGDTLVVDTVGLTDDHHWIQSGVPASDKLHIVEKYRMVDDGKALEVEFTFTDPETFEGTWVNTKKFLRENRTDIEEHVCILEQMKALPSFKYNIREETPETKARGRVKAK